VSRAARRLNPLNAPIAVQVVLILIGGLLASQAVTLALVLLMPPPAPPVYRLDEVAAALTGGPLRLHDGRVLRLGRAGAPPTAGRDDKHVEELANALAERLSAEPGRVRIRLDRRGPPLPFAELGFAAPHHDHRPPPDPASGFGSHRPELIVGEFVAAWRDPSGVWRTVAPLPGPFFSGWRREITLWFLGCVAVLAPVGYLFARRLTAPIRRFAEAAERLGRDPAGPALALDGPAEIGTAAAAFNRMQERLRRYVQDRTAMIAAISHDLRTPLARMRFKLESAPEPLRETLSADILQMEQMVSAVLAFVRDSDTARARARTRLDLLSLLECAVDDASFAGAEVAMAPAEATEIEGDPVALRSVFANLIDNGVKYGRRVVVSLSRDATEAVVEIADTGEGLPASELEQVFAPFYRAEPSRNRKTGGIGLGLTVARAIARAHGGDVTLSPGPERGLVATVRLPLGAQRP
jgi:two-component system, OmpR family, sensor kinase